MSTSIRLHISGGDARGAVTAIRIDPWVGRIFGVSGVMPVAEGWGALISSNRLDGSGRPLPVSVHSPNSQRSAERQNIAAVSTRRMMEPSEAAW